MKNILLLCVDKVIDPYEEVYGEEKFLNLGCKHEFLQIVDGELFHSYGLRISDAVTKAVIQRLWMKKESLDKIIMLFSESERMEDILAYKTEIMDYVEPGANGHGYKIPELLEIEINENIDEELVAKITEELKSEAEKENISLFIDYNGKETTVSLLYKIFERLSDEKCMKIIGI